MRGDAMIDPKAEPIGNRNPYKRVDLAARRRQRHPETITNADYKNGVIPDETLYDYDWNAQIWRLKK
jgi:hypothetical protein